MKIYQKILTIIFLKYDCDYMHNKIVDYLFNKKSSYEISNDFK